MENKDKFDQITKLTKEETERLFSEVVQNDKEKSRNNGNTICEYDKEKGEAYLLHPDGSREYFEGKLIKRRNIARAGILPLKQGALKISKNVPNRKPNRNIMQNNKHINNKTDGLVVKRNG